MLVLGQFPLPRVLFILLSVLCGTRESEAWPGVLSCICHMHSSGSLLSVAMRSQLPGRSVSGAGEAGSLLTNGGLSILLEQQGRLQLQGRYAWQKLAVINALYVLVGGG